MMKTLGVSGVIASGKSSVVNVILNHLEKRGVKAFHFDADKENAVLLFEEKDKIGKMLGIESKENFFEFKKAIKNVIFSDDEKRHRYESYMWGILKERLLSSRKRFFDTIGVKEKAVFIFDAALLFSASWDEIADLILKVVSDPDERKRRFLLRLKDSSLTDKEKENAFFLQEKAFENEKVIDINRNRKIIYTMNNTNTSISKVLDIEVDVLLNLLLETKQDAPFVSL